MPLIVLTPNLEEHPWEDIGQKRASGELLAIMGEETEQSPLRIGGLPKGMASGKTTVAIAMTLPNGTVILTETSLQLFLAAARALQAYYPNG